MFQFAQVAQMQPENMCLDLALDRAQLHAGDHSQAGPGPGFGRVRDTSERVMVGQGEGSQPGGRRGFDDIGRCSRAVRGRRMRVQVHELVLRSTWHRIAHDV